MYSMNFWLFLKFFISNFILKQVSTKRREVKALSIFKLPYVLEHKMNKKSFAYREDSL